MDLEKIVENINNGSTVKLEAEKINISDRTLQRNLKNAGYEFVRKDKKYIKTPGADAPGDAPKDLIVSSQKSISRTYNIQEDTLKALKLKSVLENKDMSEIVNSALENYIEEKYYNVNL